MKNWNFTKKYTDHKTINWRDVLWYTTVHPFHMSHSNLRTPWPIHFKFHRVIGIDSLMVCILFGEISIFHSRVMGLYSSNCRRFFLCRAVQGVLKLECDMWNGWTVVYHNTSRLKDGRIKTLHVHLVKEKLIT
jgi:hypothetical protein